MKIIKHQNLTHIAHKNIFTEKEAKKYMKDALEDDITLMITKDLTPYYRVDVKSPVIRLTSLDVMINVRAGMGPLTIEDFIRDRKILKV